MPGCPAGGGHHGQPGTCAGPWAARAASAIGSNDWAGYGILPSTLNSGICAYGSVGDSPNMLSGRPGPMPSGLATTCMSIWAALLSTGTVPVIGGRSTGSAPVAYAAAQPSTFWV